MNIVESVGKWGIVNTPHNQAYERLQQPRSGDIVKFTYTDYPYTSGKYGRIEGLGTWKKGEYHICCSLGSAFLYQNGNISISGGPFSCVAPNLLVPTYDIKYAEFWNWGNNLPGANRGVYYQIARPVFELIKK